MICLTPADGKTQDAFADWSLGRGRIMNAVTLKVGSKSGE